MPHDNHASRVVIIGGGFAGVAAAQALENRLPPAWQILLVSRENYMTFNPLLAEAVGASILPSHVVAPLRQMLGRTQFAMHDVTEIDLGAKQVFYLGEGDGVLTFDHLIIACGLRANLDLVPGMSDYALPLKTLGDALFLRNRVMVRLEHADVATSVDTKRWLGRFVVVGGGFSGVEVACEIHDCVQGARRFYPNLRDMDFQVTILHSGPHLLPEVSTKLGKYAEALLCKKGIIVRLNARAVSVDDRAVTLSDGSRLDAGTVVCTIGTAPHAFIEGLAVEKQRGRIVVRDDMSLPGFGNVWAIGDCAAVLNAEHGESAPPTAQFAVREARQAADNVARAVAGEAPRPFRYKPRGQLASLGHNRAVAEVFGIKLAGFSAWLLWRGFYLLQMPTLARKVRLYLEWNWGLLFPPDIVHLRYTRSRRGPNRVSAAAFCSKEATDAN
ncbi:MAG: NAD(P)/FAD-dependent oxidoreductase [Gammaproteobacteria bacterium]